MRERVDVYFETLLRLTKEADCTDLGGNALLIGEAFERIRDMARAAHNQGNKIMFVGNGGSQGISSHMATDYSKNGGMRSMAFTDPSVITCLSNDYGYDQVFSKQIEWHGRAGDLLIAISSSGKSPNIIRAVEAARAHGCNVATFSGFGDDNPLRRQGDVNIYVRSREYGFVEVAHIMQIHAILDLDMGWAPGR